MDYAAVVKMAPRDIIVQSSTKSNSNHQEVSPETEAERNERTQRTINNEVFVTGFTTKPKSSHWMELVKMADINPSDVENHKIFSQNGKYFITIGFIDKDVQRDFIKSIKIKNSKNKNSATRIYAHNRLTKFNSTVKKELRMLKKSSAISDFKLDGYLFKAKLIDSSAWITIDTQKALKKFTTAAKEFQDS